MDNPQVWSEIPNSHVGESIGLAKKSKNGNGNGETEITQKNEFGILGFVERTGWVEVVDTRSISVLLPNTSSLSLLFVMIMTCDVGNQIQRPAEKLLCDRVDEGSDWGLLSQLVEFVDELANSSSVNLTSLGNEDHVTFHMTSCLVVLSVGDLP